MSTVLLLLTSGQFYAPEEPGCVLSLGSDQTMNTILVSGDTSGWLQIWDISHFALDIQPQVRRSTYRDERRYVCVLRITIYLTCCPLYTATLCSASSAAVLEGSQGNDRERWGHRGGWRTVRPHSFGWWLCIAVDKRWRSHGLLWAGSALEYVSACDLPEVGFMSHRRSSGSNHEQRTQCLIVRKGKKISSVIGALTAINAEDTCWGWCV